jgi:hypothetical protein
VESANVLNVDHIWMEGTPLGKQDRRSRNPPGQLREDRRVLPRPGALERDAVGHDFDRIVPQRMEVVRIRIGGPEAETHDSGPLRVVRLRGKLRL